VPASSPATLIFPANPPFRIACSCAALPCTRSRPRTSWGCLSSNSALPAPKCPLCAILLRRFVRTRLALLRRRGWAARDAHYNEKAVVSDFKAVTINSDRADTNHLTGARSFKSSSYHHLRGDKLAIAYRWVWHQRSSKQHSMAHNLGRRGAGIRGRRRRRRDPPREYRGQSRCGFGSSSATAAHPQQHDRSLRRLWSAHHSLAGPRLIRMTCARGGHICIAGGDAQADGTQQCGSFDSIVVREDIVPFTFDF